MCFSLESQVYFVRYVFMEIEIFLNETGFESYYRNHVLKDFI